MRTAFVASRAAHIVDAIRVRQRHDIFDEAMEDLVDLFCEIPYLFRHDETRQGSEMNFPGDSFRIVHASASVGGGHRN